MAKEIDVGQLPEYLEQGADFVDVREVEELSRDGKIQNTKHWPLSTFALREAEISKTRPTIFYCRSGLRSLKAAEIASIWTKQDVYSLRDGYIAYKSQEKDLDV